jgi:leader peptidase (prepilin peptidase)/N-methyltransferase
MTPVVAVAAAAAIGALAGPWLRARIFANSVTYGRPRRHACPRCHHEVATTMSARLPATGRCPGCRRRIGPVTGLVEATGAAVLALIAWTSPDAGTFAAAAWIAGFGIVLSFVDSTVHRLPDRLTMPALAGATTIFAASAVLTSAYSHLLSAVAGAVALGGFYLVMVLIRPHAIGLGDAKVALLTGLALGWFSLTSAVGGLVAAVLIGGVAGLLLLATRHIHLRQGFAHGPAMLLGALLVFALTAL